MELVKAGAGIAVVNRWIAEPQLRAGAVAAVRLTRGGLSKPWKAVYRVPLRTGPRCAI